ncbi:aldo/keto reductase [Haloparvum sp. PAK95]|uniref:aldo/keto reductase n=1 Tax=Haloparvum sp. PAK95 TaxID=3418962 RepID=UPI003D2EDC60
MRDLPPVGIGTYDVSPEDCRRAVTCALEAGYRHVDTAEMYGNERAVGEAIEAADVAREDVFVSTKVHSKHLSYDDVLDHARRSRERLGVDAIDLLYVHWPIRSYEPAETLPAFDELVDRGTIRHVGLSNFTPALLREAMDVLDAPVFAHEVECHPLLPQPELRRLAREHDHHLVAYSPLAKGAVFQVPELAAVAEKHGSSPAQVALAWLLSKDGVVVIPKSTTPAHIRENLRATGVSLDERDVERIDELERRTRVVDFPDAPWNVGN